MVFKEVVKKMIKENGMTQAELSEKLGFETQGGFAATLGRPSIKLDMVLKILDVFGYTLAIVKKDDVNLTFLEMSEKKPEE